MCVAIISGAKVTARNAAWTHIGRNRKLAEKAAKTFVKVS